MRVISTQACFLSFFRPASPMIHLRVHSHYSLLCGAVKFQKECGKAGLRAIQGAEITDDRPVDTGPVRLVK